MKNTNAPAKNTLEAHVKRYASARNNLIIMIIFTVVNIVTMFFGSESMMLFSATIPYFAVGMGYWKADSEFLIAVISIALYLLCWFMSKKNYIWLIVATVLFSIDTAAMIYLYASTGEFESDIFDIVIHAFVLYYLIVGIVVGKKLKEIKANSVSLGEGITETTDGEFTENVYNENSDVIENTIYKRRADADVKSRILAEAVYNGRSIVYRRVKRTNELVIDGYVYDEIEMLVETPHVLTAKIDGDVIQAGLRNPSNSYISVNGTDIAKKLRII